MDRLMEILEELRPDVDFGNETGLIKDGILLGVMDIDSPKLARFDERDADGLRALCILLTECIDWSNGLL